MPFLYATDNADTLLYGFFINNDKATNTYIMSIFQRGDNLGDVALDTLMENLRKSPSFINMGFKFIRRIFPDDPLHEMAHPCKNTEPQAHRAFRIFKSHNDLQHGHYLLNQEITSELLNLLLKLSSDLEVDPNRQIFLKMMAEKYEANDANTKFRSDKINDFIDYLMPPPQLDKQQVYDPKKMLPIPYMQKKDKKKLTQAFENYMHDPNPQSNPYWTQANFPNCQVGYNPESSYGQQVIGEQFHQGFDYKTQKFMITEVAPNALLALASTCLFCYGLYTTLVPKPAVRKNNDSDREHIAVKKMK